MRYISLWDGDDSSCDQWLDTLSLYYFIQIKRSPSKIRVPFHHATHLITQSDVLSKDLTKCQLIWRPDIAIFNCEVIVWNLIDIRTALLAFRAVKFQSNTIISTLYFIALKSDGAWTLGESHCMTRARPNFRCIPLPPDYSLVARATKISNAQKQPPDERLDL